MEEKEIQKIVEGIRSRAVMMWLGGNPPTPHWYLERFYEALKYATQPNDGTPAQNITIKE